jgi:hypothetical protein
VPSGALFSKALVLQYLRGLPGARTLFARIFEYKNRVGYSWGSQVWGLREKREKSYYVIFLSLSGFFSGATFLPCIILIRSVV